MNKKSIIIFIIIISAIALVAGGIFFNNSDNSNDEIKKVLAKPVKKDRVVKIEITSGSTFGKLMTKFSDLDAKTVNGIYKTSQPVYDLAKIRVGRYLDLIYDAKTNLFKEFKYKIDSENELIVSKNPDFKELELNIDQTAVISQNRKDDSNIKEAEKTVEEPEATAPYWLAEIRPIPYEIKIRTAGGTINSSLYEYALENDIDERAIIDLANVFQWTIDFAMDPRVGDEFKFVYEERYLDGKYIMPGRILAGKYVNAGTVFQHYYFKESDDNEGYFDADGNSVQKMFLKAPVAFKYISSGFTTGRRYIKAFNISTGHRAIDYVAPAGTPIRAVGDGIVTSAGWTSSRSYGNRTQIRHNGTYSTNYAHQSKIIVKVGQRVKQGETIGYVGSTGLSTGAHLHYELVKNGVKINPLKEILPPGKPIKDENKARFFKEIKKYQKQLEL